MKLFITFSYKSGEDKKEIEAFCQIVRNAGFEDFCFIRDVENYQKIFHDPRILMERAKNEIMKCDALLIDMTNKPTGRAIEAGIAFALGKKVIVIAKKGTILKETVQGIADIIIEYEKSDDLQYSLKDSQKLFVKNN